MPLCPTEWGTTEKCQAKSDPGLSPLQTSVPEMAPRDILYEGMIILQRTMTQCLPGQVYFRDVSGAQKDLMIFLKVKAISSLSRD